jgi:hypothetical protein
MSIIIFYINTTKFIGLIGFGFSGYYMTELLSPSYYGSYNKYLIYKARNIIGLSIIGYFIGPYIVPIYYLKYLL